MASLGAFAADGGDPRMMADEKDLDVVGAPGIATYTRPQMRKLHDPNVLFEEYHYYALQTRAAEDEVYSRANAGRPTKGILSTIIPSKSEKGVGMEDRRVSLVPAVNTSDASQRAQVSDEEWVNASRAVRTAGAGAVFYLITTDILGPFNLPYAFALTGWAPGVVLYTIFGALAGISGWLLWQCFMGLDSYQFPLKNYGDIAYRLYGTPFRHFFNVLQAIQLVCSVGLIIISSGEALSEISKFRLCYAVCCLIWAIVGFGLGQIRTLQRFGFLANAAVWLNLLVIFITMGVSAHSPPLYSAYQTAAGTVYNDGVDVTPVNGVFPPIKHTAGLPAPSQISPSLNGIAQAVFAYGGAMVFTEFMAEMKRPRDFLKAVWGAQAFIYVCYMLYGLFMYAYQGQYVQTPSYLGINGYAWQTVGNVLAILSALIAAALYGNIGLKVIYNNIFMDLFKAPPLTQRTGKLLWAFLIIIYWIIAYIIGAAIPAFGGFTAVVSAACILPFTYVFPPLVNLAFHVQKNAIRVDEGFDPVTGVVTRHDGGLRRLARGFFTGRLQTVLNIWHVIYFLGALCTTALALYSGIEGLIIAYGMPQVNAFGCHSPLDSA